jgi:hypothetical protein
MHRSAIETSAPLFGSPLAWERICAARISPRENPLSLLVANLKTGEIRAKNGGGTLPGGGEVTRQLGFPRRGRTESTLK